MADFNRILQLLHFLSVCEYYMEYEGPLYFAYHFDFRGRYYYRSAVSPQSSALYRFMYHYGKYTTEQLRLIEGQYAKAQPTLEGLSPFLQRHIPQALTLLGEKGPLGVAQQHAVLWSLVALSKHRVKGRVVTTTLETMLERGLSVLAELTT